MTKILPIDSIPNDNEVAISKVIIEYIQKTDCEDIEDSLQTIRLETVNNGVASFIRMTTGNPDDKYEKIHHWSFDGDSSEMIDIIDDFKHRASLDLEKND